MVNGCTHEVVGDSRIVEVDELVGRDQTAGLTRAALCEQPFSLVLVPCFGSRYIPSRMNSSGAVHARGSRAHSAQDSEAPSGTRKETQPPFLGESSKQLENLGVHFSGCLIRSFCSWFFVNASSRTET